MADGYYSKLSQRIKEISDQNILVISVKTLADYIDISEMDPDEKDRRLKQAMASVALYQNGFRSVERGSGYFLDYRNCDNPIYLQKLCENADIDAKTKGIVLKALEEIKQKNIDTLPEYAQFVFDFDDDGNSSYIEEITRDQLVEMLKERRGGGSMIWKIIKTAMLRADIKSFAELAQVTGINPATLMQTRRRDPTSFRLYELAQLDKVLGFTVEEWEALRRA